MLNSSTSSDEDNGEMRIMLSVENETNLKGMKL